MTGKIELNSCDYLCIVIFPRIIHFISFFYVQAKQRHGNMGWWHELVAFGNIRVLIFHWTKKSGSDTMGDCRAIATLRPHTHINFLF